MELKEARELINSPIWGKVRDKFLATGEFVVYPKNDIRRLEYLPAATQREIDLWIEALAHADGWKKIVDGAQVRELKAKYAGVYPAVFRYQAYFAKWTAAGAATKDNVEFVMKLLKLKFPEAYELCCS